MAKQISDMFIITKSQIDAVAKRRDGVKMTPALKTNVTLKQVAGMNEEKREIEEFVEFLKNPQKFKRLGKIAIFSILVFRRQQF